MVAVGRISMEGMHLVHATPAELHLAQGLRTRLVGWLHNEHGEITDYRAVFEIDGMLRNLHCERFEIGADGKVRRAVAMEGDVGAILIRQEFPSQVDFAQTPPPVDGLAAVLALEVGFTALRSDAIASAGRAAKEQADRISFCDLGRRREKISQALPAGGDLEAALSSDETYRALLVRRDAFRSWQGELDGMANRAIEPGEWTASRSDRSKSDEVSDSDALAPRSRRGDETRARAARSPRRGAFGLIRSTLYLLGAIAATGGFAAFVQESQVNRPSRDSNAQAPMPDYVNLTDVWLHPVLWEALKDKNNINMLSDSDMLGKFLAERGLSFSGPTPIMRLGTRSSFDDPNVQAKFGMKCSYTARDPDQIVNILSTLSDAEDRSSFLPSLRYVPIHRMDMANLPQPMNAGADLDLVYRRQELGVDGPTSGEVVPETPYVIRSSSRARLAVSGVPLRAFASRPLSSACSPASKVAW
jgi:hypothetical protein